MSRIDNAVRRRATNWAGMLTRIAREFAPDHLKSFIHSKVTERGQGAYAITIGIKIDKHGPTADAAAQEYGSGIHDENNPHKITIVPTQGKEFLVFKWDKVEGQPGFRRTSDGKVMLKSVQHPGIRKYKGAGYLAPAIRELIAKGREELGDDVRTAIIGDLSASFKNANKR